MKSLCMKSYSKSLGREMEYKVYGDNGRTVLVFAPQDGHFTDFENFGMVRALAPFIDRGKIRLVCADSIDAETWSNTLGNPVRRIGLQEKWFHYIVDELVPAVRKDPREKLTVTGCSLGASHAANAFFRRPDLFDTLIALSGIYHAGFFFGNYHDRLVYENSPQDFLPNMADNHAYLEMYRQSRIIFCVGQGMWEDEFIESTREMERILAGKQVPAWFDYWGTDVSHDWAWWQKQLVYFLGKVIFGR